MLGFLGLIICHKCKFYQCKPTITPCVGVKTRAGSEKKNWFLLVGTHMLVLSDIALGLTKIPFISNQANGKVLTEAAVEADGVNRQSVQS